MAEHTRRAESGLLPTIRIAASGPYLDDYDIEGIGHDDGADDDPRSSFRIVLGLGRVVDFFEYRIEMPRGASGRASHGLWLVDSAASVVDPEYYGPPQRVECASVALPRVYERINVKRPDGSIDSFAIDSMTFTTRSAGESEPVFAISWILRDVPGEAVTLRYAGLASWSLESADSASEPRVLRGVTFGDPVSPRRRAGPEAR